MRMTFSGPLTRSDLEVMREMMAEVLASGATCFLIADMSGCTGIDPEARKYLADWSRASGQHLSGTAVYGLSFAMRTMVSLTLSAIKFLGQRQVAVVFVKDEAEALEWLAARRRELNANAPS